MGGGGRVPWALADVATASGFHEKDSMTISVGSPLLGAGAEPQGVDGPLQYNQRLL